jgi:hypothetical protein
MKLYSGKPEKAKTKHVFKNNDYYAGVYVQRRAYHYSGASGINECR